MVHISSSHQTDCVSTPSMGSFSKDIILENLVILLARKSINCVRPQTKKNLVLLLARMSINCVWKNRIQHLGFPHHTLGLQEYKLCMVQTKKTFTTPGPHEHKLCTVKQNPTSRVPYHTPAPWEYKLCMSPNKKKLVLLLARMSINCVQRNQTKNLVLLLIHKSINCVRQSK